MYNESVSQELYDTIQELMKEPLLNDFHLGGGTSLAIKYNYRISTDIDLFSHDIVGKDKIKDIFEFIKEKYQVLRQDFVLKNDTSENLAFTTGRIIKNNVDIKLDIIQNVRFMHPIEEKEGIRLINDLDIGALKLLSASGRGTRKDFYDLYYLTEKYSLETFYDDLLKRQKLFVGKEYENIFNIPTDKPLCDLSKNLSPLIDFTNANQIQYNKVVITDENLKNISWFNISEKWKKRVFKLADKRDIPCEETQNKRKKKGLGF